jgi:hypothetical protein
MKEATLFEDLVAARKGRTKADLIRERHKLQPQVGIRL